MYRQANFLCIKIDPRTKKEIIAEISSTATKNIEQAVRDTLERALPQEFPDKTTDETMKRIKRSTSLFKSKDNKTRYEANNNILEKIDDAINSIEKGHIEICQEKLTEGKALILKQQKIIRIADREENGWEVVKCYLSDDLASDSKDEKQCSPLPPFSEETLEPSVNQTMDKIPTKIGSEYQKSVISAEKKDISSMTVPLEERDNFDFTYKRDWEITKKTKNVSVQGRLK